MINNATVFYNNNAATRRTNYSRTYDEWEILRDAYKSAILKILYLKANECDLYEGCPKSKFPYFIKKQRHDQLERKFIYK